MADDFQSMAEVLCWSDECDSKIEALKKRYFDALCHRLGVVLATLRTRRPDAGKRIEQRFANFAEHELERFLLAPDTSRRIVTELHGIEDIADHLEAGYIEDGNHDSLLLSLVPVRIEFSDSEAGLTLFSKINHLAEITAKIIPPVGTYLRAIMRELVLSEDRSRPGFYSNSPQGLVGRAVITNGHLPFVDNVMLIEALIHEATHGFVGMSEAAGLSGGDFAEPWLTDNQPYDGVSRVVSPWTGTPLDIPTYLHACFVWWGLLHFWARVPDHPACDLARIQNRTFRAMKGFRKNAFVDQLEPYRDIIAPSLFDTFQSMGLTLQDASLPMEAAL